PKIGLALTIACLAALPLAAQATRDIVGTWQGTLPIGKSERIVVKISRQGAALSGTVFNLESEMAYEGRTTTQMSQQAADFRFAIAPIAASFTGKLSDDASSIAGTWTQADKAYPLTLARAGGDAQWEIPKQNQQMAKDADPDWEAVTIKPSDPDDQKSGFQMNGRQLYMERTTVESMLLFAYGVHKKQIAGAPDWADTDRWDMRGVPDVPDQPSIKQYQSMVRKLLVDRFGLKSHTESREMPVYALTLAKGGSKLTKSQGDPSGLMHGNDHENGGQRIMQETNITMNEFALIMKFFMDRPVVDQTGLTDRYDFQFKWTFDETRVPADGTAAPGLFTAIQEQLGLRLDAVKAPAEVLVIDHIDRPSAN
ncbi:MAG: TIGR03435 family protein, partial [Acidobacteriota bacterium]|nr:TIGR03435 family protein [Acidobacteriota bacterium]